MEVKREPQPPIIDQLRQYFETRIKLAKYQAIESGSSILASVIAEAAAMVCALFAFIFASFALAFFLGDVLNGNWKGFGIVAILYLIFAIVLKYSKHILEKPIANSFIQKFFK